MCSCQKRLDVGTERVAPCSLPAVAPSLKHGESGRFLAISRPFGGKFICIWVHKGGNGTGIGVIFIREFQIFDFLFVLFQTCWQKGVGPFIYRELFSVFMKVSLFRSLFRADGKDRVES